MLHISSAELDRSIQSSGASLSGSALALNQKRYRSIMSRLASSGRTTVSAVEMIFVNWWKRISFALRKSRKEFSPHGWTKSGAVTRTIPLRRTGVLSYVSVRAVIESYSITAVGASARQVARRFGLLRSDWRPDPPSHIDRYLGGRMTLTWWRLAMSDLFPSSTRFPSIPRSVWECAPIRRLLEQRSAESTTIRAYQHELRELSQREPMLLAGYQSGSRIGKLLNSLGFKSGLDRLMVQADLMQVLIEADLLSRKLISAQVISVAKGIRGPVAQTVASAIVMHNHVYKARYPGGEMCMGGGGCRSPGDERLGRETNERVHPALAGFVRFLTFDQVRL